MDNPVYISKKLPLKTWNIGFKRSVILDKCYVTSITFLPDSEVIVTGDSGGNVTFWRLAGYKQIFSKTIHKSDVTSLCYMNNGTTLFTGSADSTIAKVTMNIEKNNYSVYQSEKEEGRVLGLCSAMDGDNLLSVMNNKIIYWDIQNCNVTKEFEVSEEVITAFLFIFEMKIVVIGTKGSLIKFVNPYDQSIKFTIDNAHNYTLIRSITTCYLDDNFTICTSGEDMKLKFWTYDEKTLVKTESFNTNAIQVSYCFDYKTLLVVLDSGVFTLFNYENGQKKDFFTRKIPYNCGAYLGDGKNFITSCVDFSLEFYGMKQ